MKEKPITKNIINLCNIIKQYLESDLFINHCDQNQLLFENNYIVGEISLSDSLELLKLICLNIPKQENSLNYLEIGIKNGIYNNLNNINIWLPINTIQTQWQNIINSVISINLSINQNGININLSKNLNAEIIGKLNILELTLKDIEKINKLKNDLNEILKASRKIDEAKDIINFVNNTTQIKEIDSYIIDKTKEINELTEKSSQLLETSSNISLVRHFSNISENYTCAYQTWKYGIYIGFVIIIANIYTIISFKENIQTKIENNIYIELIANGLIRLICLTPSILFYQFVLSNYNKAKELKKKYEFKAATSFALEGHIIQIKKYLDTRKPEDNKILINFIDKTINEIFDNPIKEVKAKNEELSLESIKKEISFLDKMKNLFVSK